MAFTITTRGFKALKRAIERNPQTVQKETGKFLARGIAVYNRGILQNPWEIGESGGGAPVDTGHLRDTHRKRMEPFRASIFPTAQYASYVHGLNGKKRNTRGVQLRPWLDYVQKNSEREIRMLERDLISSIIKDLAK